MITGIQTLDNILAIVFFVIVPIIGIALSAREAKDRDTAGK